MAGMDVLTHCAECEQPIPAGHELRWNAGLPGERWTCAMCEVERLEDVVRQLRGVVDPSEAERLRAFIASKREIRFEARCLGLISSEEYVASLEATADRFRGAV